MATGEFYEVTLFYGADLLNLFQNRWHYEQTGGLAASASALAGSWQVSVLTPLAGIMAPETVFQRVLVQNLITIADNTEDLTPTPNLGSSLNPAVPDTLAYSFRSARPDLSKRHSYKRFGGVASTLLVGRNWNISASAVINLQTAMGSVINPGTNNWKPVQLRETTDPITGVITYSKNYDITSWQAIAKPSTQDSRKR